MVPKRFATSRVKRLEGCSEPISASAMVKCGRFESAAKLSTSAVGTATIASPPARPRKGLQGRAETGEERPGHPVGGDISRQRDERQERHLIRVKRNQRREKARQCAIARGAEAQAALQHPERPGEIDQRKDLPRMLDAPRGRTAIGKGNGRNERCRGVPAPVTAETENAERAEKQAREGHRIGHAHGGVGREQRQQQMRRREDQRLRIGDLRVPAKHERRPERAFTAMDGLCQKHDLRMEMRLGIPGDCHGTGKPGPGKPQPDQHEKPRHRKPRPRIVSRRNNRRVGDARKRDRREVPQRLR